MEMEMTNCEDEFEEDVIMSEDYDYEFDDLEQDRDEVVRELQRTIADDYEARHILLGIMGQ